MPDDRLKRGAELFLRWRRLEYEQPPEDWTPEKTELFKSRTFTKLLEVYEPEILQGILDDFVGCVLCDVNIEVENGQVKRVSYPAAIASSGLRRAATTIAKVGKTRPFHEHVKLCTAEVLAEYQAEVREEWRRLPPEEILPHVVNRSRRAAAVLLEQLTDKQRSDLRGLLQRQLADNKAIPLRMDIEPKDQHRWVFWYLWRRELTQPETMSAIGGVPRAVLAPAEVRVNKKTGKPYDPLGVIHAKIWQRLSREKNIHAPPIQNPGSTSPIARSLGVSRQTAGDYLKADIPIEFTPDGKGGLDVRVPLEGVLAALEVYSTKKRGRKPKQS